MRFIFSILFLSILLQRCKDSPKAIPQKAITKLDFTYAFPVKAIFYSLKFSAGDTVYIKNYSPSQSDTSFQTILTKEDRSKIDSIINSMSLSALDSSYDSRHIDGDEYHLSISKNDTLKTVYIHGGEVPGELRRLMDYATELKTKLTDHSHEKNN
jgi:hypothetical protein